MKHQRGSLGWGRGEWKWVKHMTIEAKKKQPQDKLWTNEIYNMLALDFTWRQHLVAINNCIIMTMTIKY